MSEVPGIVVELQREKLGVARSGTIASLQRFHSLETLAELGIKHHICTPGVSEPDLNLAGDWRSLWAHGDESRGCAMVGAEDGWFSE